MSIAAAEGHRKVLHQLLRHDTEAVNHTNAKGNTPLMTACRYGRVGAAELLAKQDNCDLRILNDNCQNAVSLALRKQQASPLLRVLRIAQLKQKMKK
eukprot:CAMPEP_0194133274 /NCGR_PEP_ID=MMETSP0152-20130528/3517_1 /TAXON_ID=1049557 /ORGANISM="Thalassiothrix antarctica, Strain L6-D1" /LENGTH=96 /DNA_ID=CAMNT_0038828563 /DNA_START=1204 /DNA_END=1494 /DNA_ORIENTATION=+